MLQAHLKPKAQLPPLLPNFLSLSAGAVLANENTTWLKEEVSCHSSFPCCQFLNLRTSPCVHYCILFLQDLMVRGRSTKSRTHWWSSSFRCQVLAVFLENFALSINWCAIQSREILCAGFWPLQMLNHENIWFIEFLLPHHNLAKVVMTTISELKWLWYLYHIYNVYFGM